MNYLSINSIKNKFESIEEIIQNTFYISIFSETKIDSACPSQQCSILEYPFSGGIVMQMGEDYFFMLITI